MDITTEKLGTVMKAIRFPKDVYEAVFQMSGTEERTFTGQVLYLLRRSLSEPCAKDR